MIQTIKFLNINITSVKSWELLGLLDKGIVVTPNADHVILLQRDQEFYEVYKNAEWVLCDSKILAICMKYLKSPVAEVIPGSSLFPAYCNFHKNNPAIRIFLLGAAPGVADKALSVINKRIGRNIVVGAHSPSYGFEKNENECNEIINIINHSGANVLVIGVGAPKQEKWIFKFKDKFSDVKLFMALGATIDFEAGNIKRAPVWMQKLCIEWLYRLIKEPKRLWKRYLLDDPKIFGYIIKQKMGLYKNPFECYI